MCDYDVIIIGAGISGLTAAYQLKCADPKLEIVILEAKDRVGGRTLSVELKASKGTDIWDIGGQWVSSSQFHIMSLLEELGFEIYPQYIEGTKFSQLGDSSIQKYKGSIPSVSILPALELHFLIQKVENLCKEVSVENPFLHPKAKELDAITCEAFKTKHLTWKSSRDLMDIAFRTSFGLDPSRCSVLALAAIANSAGGYMRLFEVMNQGAQEFRVKGGTQQISSKLAENQTVLLKHVVTEIIQDPEVDERIDVIANDEIFSAQRVIIAIPINEAAKILFNPRLSEGHQMLLNNMPVGHLTKFIVTYEKAFWREKGFSGEIVSNGGIKIHDNCDTSPIGVVFDATTHNSNPALLGFIAAYQGIQWKSTTYNERKSCILQSLAEFFGKEALSPIDYIEKIWSDEPFNGGCPVNISTPGIAQFIGSSLRKPVGRIHWAGTDTATVWCGYLSGAVQAGQRAAKEVLYHLRPKSLTVKDLEDTAYAVIVEDPPKTTNGSCLFTVTVGLSLFFIVLFAAKKSYFRMAI